MSSTCLRRRISSSEGPAGAAGAADAEACSTAADGSATAGALATPAAVGDVACCGSATTTTASVSSRSCTNESAQRRAVQTTVKRVTRRAGQLREPHLFGRAQAHEVGHHGLLVHAVRCVCPRLSASPCLATATRLPTTSSASKSGATPSARCAASSAAAMLRPASGVRGCSGETLCVSEREQAFWPVGVRPERPSRPCPCPARSPAAGCPRARREPRRPQSCHRTLSASSAEHTQTRVRRHDRSPAGEVGHRSGQRLRWIAAARERGARQVVALCEPTHSFSHRRRLTRTGGSGTSTC
jgi:hypothetical protein